MKTILTILSVFLFVFASANNPKDVSIKFTPNANSNKIEILGIADDLCISCFRSDNGGLNSNNHQLDCPKEAVDWLIKNRVNIVYLNKIYRFEKTTGGSIDFVYLGENVKSNPLYDTCNNCVGTSCDIFTPFNFKTSVNCDSVFLSWSFISNNLPAFEVTRNYNGSLISFFLSDTVYVEKLGLNGTYIYTIRNGTSSVSESLDLSDCSALPVELMDFRASIINDVVVLEWITMSEKNNSHFEVQSSSDAVSFETIGVVSGYGFSSSKIEYSFIDKYPKSGITYYRLKQVDYDGVYEFSNIISIEYDKKSSGTLVYPNPTTKLFTFQSDVPIINIVSSIGSEISYSSIEIGVDKYIIDVFDYVPGLYLIFTSNEVIRIIIK